MVNGKQHAYNNNVPTSVHVVEEQMPWYSPNLLNTNLWLLITSWKTRRNLLFRNTEMYSITAMAIIVSTFLTIRTVALPYASAVPYTRMTDICAYYIIRHQLS